MEEKRFRKGQKVTYLKGPYNYGGGGYEGYVGKIEGYNSFNKVANCWSMEVTSRHAWAFTMLESEFEEYFKPRVTKTKSTTIDNYSIC